MEKVVNFIGLDHCVRTLLAHSVLVVEFEPVVFGLDLSQQLLLLLLGEEVVVDEVV